MPEISTISESTNPWGSVEIPVILLSFTDKVIFSTTLIFVLSAALMNNYLNNFLFKLNKNENT